MPGNPPALRSGGADLVGVNDLFARRTDLDAKNLASPSLFAFAR